MAFSVDQIFFCAFSVANRARRFDRCLPARHPISSFRVPAFLIIHEKVGIFRQIKKRGNQNAKQEFTIRFFHGFAGEKTPLSERREPRVYPRGKGKNAVFAFGDQTRVSTWKT